MEILKRARWILISVALFSLIHYSITYISNGIEIEQENYKKTVSWLNFAALFNYFICAAFAGMFHKGSFIVGVVAGLLCAISAIVIFGVAVNDISGKLITIATGLVLGGFGGFTSMFIKRRLNKAC